MKGPDGAAQLPPLTVGTKFELDCSGDIPVTWKGAPQIQLPEKALPYSLYILSVKKLESTAAEFVVTSYRPGQMKPDYVRVMTGDAGFETSGLEWSVQSVVKQDQKQPPQPYPPYGPFALAMPYWVWLVVALVVASVSTVVWRWFRRVQNRRRLADDLARFGGGGLSPSAQFHKELRQLSRKLLTAKSNEASDWNATLDQSLRVYLMREYGFLTLKVPRSKLFRSLGRILRQAQPETLAGVEKIFSEMDRFQTHAAEHKSSDYEQIIHIARVWCDQIEKRKVKRA